MFELKLVLVNVTQDMKKKTFSSEFTPKLFDFQHW